MYRILFRQYSLGEYLRAVFTAVPILMTDIEYSNTVVLGVASAYYVVRGAAFRKPSFLANSILVLILIS